MTRQADDVGAGPGQRVILEATAEAESIKVRAEATAVSLARVGRELSSGGGMVWRCRLTLGFQS